MSNTWTFGGNEGVTIYVALAMILLWIVLVIAPLVGIKRAAARRGRAERSTAAVVLASVGTFASAVLALAHLWPPLYATCLILANLAWLRFAVQTNRSVSRRLALASSQNSPPRN